MIAEHEQSHGLDHRNGAREHTRIMASPGCEGCLGLVFRHRFLFAGNGCGRFESDAKDQVFAVADPTLDASGTVALSPNFSLPNLERIVMLGTFEPRGREAGADFEALSRGQTQHRLCQIRFEFIENWFAQTGWKTADDAFDNSA